MSFSADQRAEEADDLPSTVLVGPGEGPADDSLESVEATTLRDMATAWREGRCLPAERWLEQQPRLKAQSETAVRIVYEEVCLREELGESVASIELYHRFPQWRPELEVLLDCHRLVPPLPATVDFPQPGERLGDFQLLSEVDRGAVGRVYLATQPGLSDRPLVVKLIPRSGDEHLSLARLQHSHIAPLYLVQDFPSTNLRALCMPYLGGTSLARLLEGFAGAPPSGRSGAQLVELLSRSQADAPIEVAFGGPALRFLARATYTQAVCWIAACLADALHYAHQRGLLHLDIKPSNVLLAGDGQPMLLDFHLARQVILPQTGPIDRLGGTRGYMSHEQELAGVAVVEGRPLALGLDGRSDIYSLGVLLYESLSGVLPPADQAASRKQLRAVNPAVGRGLEDIVHKCLQRDAHRRYADAGELAADLRRDLADLPLEGVPNRLAERWQKWRRRRVHSLAVMTMGLFATAAIATIAYLFASDRLSEARLALRQGQEHRDRGDYEPAIERLQTGWDKIRWFPGQFDLKQAIQSQLSLARRSRLAHALHVLVEQLRFVDHFETVPAAKLRELDSGCAKVWQAREQIMRGDAANSNSAIDGQLRADLLDLALLWAEVRQQLASADEAQQSRAEALALLDEAQALCGPSPILELSRRQYSTPDRAMSDMASLGATIQPRTTWEHFAVGRFLFRADELESAQREFEQAIALEANSFWPNFYRMLCAYRLERFEEALNAASACVALSPQSAPCFYNRALSHEALSHREQAIADYNRGLELDPALALAAEHRDMLLLEMGR